MVKVNGKSVKGKKGKRLKWCQVGSGAARCGKEW